MSGLFYKGENYQNVGQKGDTDDPLTRKLIRDGTIRYNPTYWGEHFVGSFEHVVDLLSRLGILATVQVLSSGDISVQLSDKRDAVLKCTKADVLHCDASNNPLYIGDYQVLSHLIDN